MLNLDDYFKDAQLSSDGSISAELEKLIGELGLLGYRERTLYDYRYHMIRLSEITGIRKVSDIDREVLIRYISEGDVAPSTRRIRLKTTRAVLNHWLERGVVTEKFWDKIRIRVDEPVKQGSSSNDVKSLLNTLDMDNFVEFRDACMVLTVWETGARSSSLVKLKDNMVYKQEIQFSGGTMKNHTPITLPISYQLSHLLEDLVERNNKIRARKNQENEYLFIGRHGTPMHPDAFGKRMNIYKSRTGLQNINPHAIRRGFAKRLLDNGVSVPIISRALNHKDISTTTRYLRIENEEVIDKLRSVIEP